MKLTDNKKWSAILLHAITWMIVFTLPYLLNSSHNNPHRIKSPLEETEFFYLNLFTYFFWIASFYLNSAVLTPKFIYTKKYGIYIGLLLVLFAVIMSFHVLLYDLIISSSRCKLLNSVRYNLPTYLLAIATSTVYRMSRDRRHSEELMQQTRQEHLKTELSFLRSQISPHFVFNVLNNIVALVRMKSEELEPTIIKLSSLMHYMVYETNEERVLLSSEAAYLQSYIDLQQQRFGSKVAVITNINLSGQWSEIEPMLLIPFVENAFKHGTGLMDQPQIFINLDVKDQVLHFFVRNKYNENTSEVKDKIQGIGMANVTRRLNLLYTHEHTLEVTRKDGWFTIDLKINLHTQPGNI